MDVATGSLGQGLPIGVGIALAGKRLDRLPYRVWVLCGDSEMAEGSMWEAFEHAGYYELDNLIAIIDVNRLGQRGETMHGWDLDAYARRAEAFGWHAIEIDGHDVEADRRAPTRRRRATTGKPTVDRRAHDEGQGREAVENKDGWHGKPLDDPDAAIAELGGDAQHRRRRRRSPRPATPHRVRDRRSARAADATRSARRSRRARPTATRSRRSAPRAATSSRSTARSRTRPSPRCSRKAHPERFFEMYIAEQQMVAAAVGHAGARLDAVRLDVRGVPLARLRLHPHGGDRRARRSRSAARTPASRSARTARRRWRSRTSPMFRAVHG